MGKVHWKTSEQIEQERLQREQEQQAKEARRQRIREGVANANSIKALRELVKDIAEELGIVE